MFINESWIKKRPRKSTFFSSYSFAKMDCLIIVSSEGWSMLFKVILSHLTVPLKQLKSKTTAIKMFSSSVLQQEVQSNLENRGSLFYGFRIPYLKFLRADWFGVWKFYDFRKVGKCIICVLHPTAEGSEVVFSTKHTNITAFTINGNLIKCHHSQ